MSETSILIVSLGLQPLLYAVGWWLVAARLPAERVALRHWALSSAAGGLSMLLFTETASQALGEAALTLRNTGLLLSFVLLRRGLLLFVRQPTRDAEQWLLLMAASLAMASLGSSPETLPWRSALLSSAAAWMLIRGGWELRRVGAAEFGGVIVSLVSLPMLLFGTMLAVRGAASLVERTPQAMSIVHGGTHNVLLLLVPLVLLSAFHFALGYLVLTRIVAELRHLSSHDSLTRLLNRHAFEQALDRELQVSRRTGRELGLLMVDVDHFKRINDTYGHAVGDHALRAIGQRLQQASRGSDSLGRIGGEEFALLLPATDIDGVREAAERLRQAVAGEALQTAEAELCLTVSVGATLRIDAADDASALLRRADRALYRAKLAGRNRVEIETDRGPGSAALARAVPTSAGLV